MASGRHESGARAIDAMLSRMDRENQAKQEINENAQKVQTEQTEKEKYASVVMNDGFITPDFFFYTRDGNAELLLNKKCTLKEITDDFKSAIGEYIPNGYSTEVNTKIMRERAKAIFYYMSDYGIIDNSIEYLPYRKGRYDLPIGKIIADLKSNPQKSISDRFIEMIDTIESAEDVELYMLDAFFTNVATKIIKKIREEYCDDEYNDLYETYRRTDRRIDDSEASIEQWLKTVPDYENISAEDFSSFIRLREMERRLYWQKCNDMIRANTMAPSRMKWMRFLDKDGNPANDAVMSAKLDGYAFPISLHIKQKSMDSDFFDSIPIYSASGELHFWPFTFTTQEISKIKKKIADYYYFKGIDIDTLDDVLLEENTIVSETKTIKEEQEERKIEQQVVRKRGKQSKYRNNDVLVDDIERDLINDGIINGFTDEQMEGLTKISSSTKLEMYLNGMVKFLRTKDIPEERLNSDAEKLFVYMKLANRGFFVTGQERKQRSLETSYAELQKYGDDFWNMVNAQASINYIKDGMNSIAGNSKAPNRTIARAKSMEGRYTSESLPKELIGENQTKQPEIIMYEEYQAGKYQKQETIPNEELSVEDELDQMIQEHNQLKAIEAEIQARKTVLEKELSDLINSKGQLKAQKQKYEIALNPKFRAFFTEIEINENTIAEIERKLEQAKAELERLEKEENDKKTEINETDEELSENKKQQENIKKDVDDFLHGL